MKLPIQNDNAAEKSGNRSIVRLQGGRGKGGVNIHCGCVWVSVRHLSQIACEPKHELSVFDFDCEGEWRKGFTKFQSPDDTGLGI